MHLATRLDRYPPCCMRLWRWLVLLLVHVSIGTAHRPAHANGLGFFFGKGEIFQVLALPYVLLPTPVEDPYGAQSVPNILDLQSGAIYACVHPHQRYNALPLFFGYVHASTPFRQFPNHLRRQGLCEVLCDCTYRCLCSSQISFSSSRPESVILNTAP